MQHVYILLGLCLLLGVCVTSGFADISLTSRNGPNGGSGYLPPPAQSLPIDDAINEAINEEIIKIQEESNTRSKFDESKYGNANYHVFEVHNQFNNQQQQKAGSYAQGQVQAQAQAHVHGPSYAQDQAQGHSGSAQNPFKGPDYLPPHHGSSGQQGNDDHFDLSFVNNAFADNVPAQGPHQAPAPSSNPIPVPFPSSYQHDFQQNTPQQVSAFKGPDYLPPNHETSLPEVNNYNDISIDSQRQGSNGGSAGFKGPDYLPPIDYPQQSGSVAHAQAGVNVGAIANSGAGAGAGAGAAGVSAGAGAFRGPDYLPPHESQISAGVDIGSNAGGNSGAFRGPEYLPPFQSQAGSGSANLSPANFGPSTFRGPDYLPPHQGTQIGAAHQTSSVQGQFKGPDYLPPHTGNTYEQGGQQATQYAGQAGAQIGADTGVYHAPEYLPPHEAQLSQPIAPSNNFKGPDYLPPHQEVPQQLQLSQPQQAAFKGPEYLPPLGQSSAAAASAAAAAAQSSPSSSFQAPAYDFNNLPATPGLLPDGYDFERPDNAEEAIAELHSLQIAQQQQEQQHLQQGQQGQQGQQEVVVQSQIQVSGREADGDIVYGQPKPELSGNFQGNAYLPPGNAGGANIQGQSQANYQIQQGNVQTLGSSYGRAAGAGTYAQQQQTYSAPEYLPPVSGSSLASSSSGAAGAAPHIHSLSSYMTAVQPFERYGSAQFTGPRKPFAEYGPPKSSALPVVQPQAQPLPVAPMYREQGTRFQYYAPAMSYSSSSVGQRFQSHSHNSGYTLNQQARQSLQRFMPKEIQQASQYAAPPAAVATVARAPAAPVAPQTPITVTAHAQAIAQPHSQPALAPAPVAGAALPAVASIAAKVRTVQIISANTVKTLKVLESSDQAGVKTIKILGPSNEPPRGDHRVVKVVTSHGNGHDNHVQTVKIFNDQQDVPLRGNNAYLPPAFRSTRKRSVRKVRQTLQRHFAHGHSRRRNRY